MRKAPTFSLIRSYVMKPVFYMVLFIFMPLLSTGRQVGGTLTLIPEPVSVQRGNEHFTVENGTVIYVEDGKDETYQVAEYLQNMLKPATGFELAIKNKEGKRGIRLYLFDRERAELGEEGYHLESSKREVVIKANKAAGLFYGVQTLLQLLPTEIESRETVQNVAWLVPEVDITDYPRFGWRGVMLDVSRHFFTKEEVKHLIRQMARYKYNRFHWHLTDDHGWRVEIKSLPELTEKGAWRVERYGTFGERRDPEPGEAATYGGYYTQEDIREVVAYAKEHYIEVMPEVDVPGHSSAAVAVYPNLSVTGDSTMFVNPGTKFSEWHGDGKFTMLIDNTLDPTNEEVYAFLDKVYGEIAELFPFSYIHMGGDEAYHGYWERDSTVQAFMEERGLEDGKALQSYFVKRVNDIITSKGKKMIGWDEIMDGGLAEGAAVMSWRGTKGGVEASQNGAKVVMSPWPEAYLDLYQGVRGAEPPTYGNARLSKSYAWDPIPEGADSANILGGQGNIWTENIPHPAQMQYMAYPRLLALSEVYWSPKGKRDWPRMVQKIEAEFPRLDEAGINYARSMYDPIIEVNKNESGELVMTLTTELEGLDIYYTLDGSLPNQYAPHYEAPFVIPEGVDFVRIISYRDGKPVGKLISRTAESLR